MVIGLFLPGRFVPPDPGGLSRLKLCDRKSVPIEVGLSLCDPSLCDQVGPRTPDPMTPDDSLTPGLVCHTGCSLL